MVAMRPGTPVPREAATPASAPRRSSTRRFVGIAADGRAWLRILYLALAFPIGLASFIALVVLIAVGGATFITLVGIPLLVLTVYGWGLAARGERLLANQLLGTRIPKLAFQDTGSLWDWSRMKRRLSNPLTWTSLVFLFLRFPLGVAALVFVCLLAVPLTFIATPVIAAFGGESEVFFWTIDTVWEGIPLAMAGVPLAFVGLHFLNWYAKLNGWLANFLLGSAAAHAIDSPVAPAALVPALTTFAAPEASPETAAVATAIAMAPSAALETSRPAVTAPTASVAAAGPPDPAAGTTARPFQPARWPAPRPALSAAPEPVTPLAISAPAESAAATEEPSFATPPEQSAGAGEPAAPEPRLTVDVAMRLVTVEGRRVELTPREFDLIALFVQNPSRPFSRDELLDRIWKHDFEVTDRTIDTHVQRLRKKLGPGAVAIRTVWGVGYRFEPTAVDEERPQDSAPAG